MNRTWSQLTTIVWATLLITLIGGMYHTQEAAGKVYEGMEAPLFSLNDVAGNPKSFLHLKEKKTLTVVVFWSTWNKQSFEELKAVQKLYSDYQSKGLQVIGINVEDVTISKSQLQYILDYTKEAGITFPVLLDQGLKVFNLYGIIALPTTFLINDTGIIVGKLAGYPISSRNQLMKTIRETIQPGSAKELSGPPQVAIPNGKAHRYYQMAKVLNERGNYPGAIESLRKSIALDQNFLPAHNLLATTLFKTGQQEEARDIFNNIIASNPHNLLFQLDYGNFLIQSGSADQGLAVLRQVLAEDNNYAIGHYYLGNYLFQQGAIDEALREAQSAVELNPFDYKSYRLLGNLYEAQQKSSQSLVAYKKASSLLENRLKVKDFYLSLCY